MTVTSTFFIALGGDGAVALGTLEGDGLLRPKDIAIADGEQWKVLRLKGFKKVFKEAGPGTNIGVAFGTGLPAEMFDGKTLTFRRG